MAAACISTENDRQQLSQTILDVLRSWPEHHQRIFIEAHYQGHSTEAISVSLGLRVDEVRLILGGCERKLCAALKAFREIPHEEESRRESSFSRSSFFR